jgi:hypothetical protein
MYSKIFFWLGLKRNAADTGTAQKMRRTSNASSSCVLAGND